MTGCRKVKGAKPVATERKSKEKVVDFMVVLIVGDELVASYLDEGCGLWGLICEKEKCA